MNNLPVLILAGSREKEHDPLARFGKVSHKALLPVRNVPMLERVVSTIERVKGTGTIYVCIESSDYLNFLGKRVRFFPASASPSETVLNAIKQIGTPCLVTTADHALLRPDWVEEFLEKSQKSGAVLTAGIALKATIERDVPQTRRTYIHLSDAVFSGCNLFWLGTSRAINVVRLWQTLQQNRKRPLHMALTLGLGTLFCALFRQLSSKGLTKRIKTLTGADIALIALSDGKAAVDIDKISDYHLAEQLL